jgi:mRNA (guanine-N7-)-methyltransferase
VFSSTFFRLAEKYGLQLVAKERFHEYYEKVKEEGRSLLGKMQALEVRLQDSCYFYIHI